MLKTQTLHGTTWIDVERPSPQVLAGLEHDYRLHPIHVKESLQKIQLNQVEREDNYLFFVLHMPIFASRTAKVVVNQVGIFLGKDFLITIRSGAGPAVTDLFELCQKQPTEGETYFEKGSDYLLYVLISGLLSDISRMTDDVIGELDEVETLVFDDNTSDAQRIGKLRQKIVRLSRIIGPKRMVLQDLAGQITSFAGPGMTKYHSNNAKTANKLWEVIEESKETVEIFKDADFTTSTEQTNEILAILTLLFTFTIPITVVGTLYGMNVLLPGGIEAGPWLLLGRYTTFAVLVTVSAAVALAMYLYFKNKKWF